MDDAVDRQKMLDLYILDYVRRKGMHGTAEIFAKEANLVHDSSVDNQGFLKEWWDTHFEILSSRPPENAETRKRAFSQMLEQHNLGLPARVVDPKRQHLGVQKLNSMLPSSSSPSHLQMQSAGKSEQQVPMEDRHATNLGRSTLVVPTPSGTPKGICPRIDSLYTDSPLSMFCSYRVSENKLLCCHFSSEGNLLATAGHEMKVLILNFETHSTNIMEGHSHLITDIRFRANSTTFATSSFDGTVQIWDATMPSKSLFRLSGHAGRVMSLDFHPRRTTLLCSCDSTGEIRMWDIIQCVCTQTFKGGSRQVRFQPQLGDLLAAAIENVVNLIDVNSNVVQYKLEGHTKAVCCICWDISGSYIASISEDSARIWSTILGGQCTHELRSVGNKFESCIFHPRDIHLLVIGSDQTLEIWNLNDHNRIWTCHAHNGVIASLAASPKAEIIATASHDQWIKLWR